MKKQIMQSINLVVKDRQLAIPLAIFLLLCVFAIIYLSFSIHASELQVVIHYTSFGVTNFYRNKWYYLIGFVAFILILAIVHSALTVKIFQAKGKELALPFVWLSILTLFIAVSIFYQILKIASLS